MKNAENTKLTIGQMDQVFVAYCKANNWEIEDRKRAEGGSMYYDVCSEVAFASFQVRISDHPFKYGMPAYSVGDDSFEGLFIFMENEVAEANAKNLIIKMSLGFWANKAA